MKRIRVALIGVLLLVLAPALVPAEAAAAPVSRDQAVNLVITRGLAQRGVPTRGGAAISTAPAWATAPAPAPWASTPPD